MELDKAIEINQQLQVDLTINLSDDQIRANQLGIEALKRVEITREQHLFQCWILLPGETPTEMINPSEDEIKKLRESPIGEK